MWVSGTSLIHKGRRSRTWRLRWVGVMLWPYPLFHVINGVWIGASPATELKLNYRNKIIITGTNRCKMIFLMPEWENNWHFVPPQSVYFFFVGLYAAEHLRFGAIISTSSSEVFMPPVSHLSMLDTFGMGLWKFWQQHLSPSSYYSLPGYCFNSSAVSVLTTGYEGMSVFVLYQLL